MNFQITYYFGKISIQKLAVSLPVLMISSWSTNVIFTLEGVLSERSGFKVFQSFRFQHIASKQ